MKNRASSINMIKETTLAHTYSSAGLTIRGAIKQIKKRELSMVLPEVMGNGRALVQQTFNRAELVGS